MLSLWVLSESLGLSVTWTGFCCSIGGGRKAPFCLFNFTVAMTSVYCGLGSLSVIYSCHLNRRKRLQGNWETYEVNPLSNSKEKRDTQ